MLCSLCFYIHKTFEYGVSGCILTICVILKFRTCKISLFFLKRSDNLYSDTGWPFPYCMVSISLVDVRVILSPAMLEIFLFVFNVFQQASDSYCIWILSFDQSGIRVIV
jgi:hypothetical protein